LTVKISGIRVTRSLVLCVCFVDRCLSFSLTEKSLKIPKGYQNPYIEEEQTTQWPKEKEQNDKQRSTKHTHKTKDRGERY
jgi:hypothetical protein